jgi:hypothetical protein
MTAWDARPPLGRPSAAYCPRHHGTKTSGRADRRASPHRPARNAFAARLLRAEVRRGAQEAQFDDQVACTRREPAQCPRHRLKPMARRVAHLHRVATTTLHDQPPTE